MVSGSLSEPNEGEPKGSSSFVTYTEIFYQHFPYYLSIGMTYEQYWDGTPSLAKYYRKAEEMRRERANHDMWLQGMYVYEAICDASPILHAFAKKGTKPHPYAEKPYSLTQKEAERNKVVKEKEVFDKGKKFMEMFMEANNKKFQEKENTSRKIVTGGEYNVN